MGSLRKLGNGEPGDEVEPPPPPPEPGQVYGISSREALLIEDQYVEIARQRLKDYRNGTLRTRPLAKPIYAKGKWKAFP